MIRTDADYAAKHAELTRQIEEAAAAIPPEAREIVEKVDALVSDKSTALGALLEARRKLEQEFHVSAALAKERRAQEEAEQRQALALALVDDVESYLEHVEAFEASVAQMFDAFDGAMLALTQARQKAKTLSGQGRGFDHIMVSNRLVERFQALAKKRVRAQRWGQLPMSGGSIFWNRETGMREQEEREIAPALENALGG